MDYYIGLMSGTSMDGIDVAAVDVGSHQLIKGMTMPYSLALKQKLDMLLQQQGGSFQTIAELNYLIGAEFANAVNGLLNEINIPKEAFKAIGSHGQTVAHDAYAHPPYTVQLGCAHTIAERTGIPVVADFRTRDLVVGGQGAPFAPLYHRELFFTPGEVNALVNIGGIANISIIDELGQTQGWDVGPGNCLMDLWCQLHLNQPYDREGLWAKSGEVIPGLLQTMMDDPFFAKTPPKSLGKEYFSLDWLQKIGGEYSYPAQSIQATLLKFTAFAIARAVLESKKCIDRLYLCGGGAHNLALLEAIQKLLPDVQVNTTEVKGVSADFLEAMLFAWLASKTIKAEKLDLSQITGAKAAALLGSIYPV